MAQEEERLTNATNSLARPSSPLYQCLSSRKRRGLLGYVKLQEPYRKRRSSVRVLRLGATKARKLTWQLRPKLLRLRFLSPGLLLKKLTGAFLRLATIFAAKNELPADRVVEGICLQLHQSAAYIAYLERTIAEGRFYRNGMAILDLKEL